MAELVRGGEVSPVELVEAHLRRIDAFNARLNALVTLAPDALERAREIEAALKRGDEVGPLAGVPVTVKDTIETAGLRTTFGSRVFKDHVPRDDAPSVARLRGAGAIILGKTNASELALDYTADNEVFGRTNNPFDERRTPGGSSGGCAAAVCACMSAGGLGSDLAGSIRIPAHFCGVAGLRPTTGRIPGESNRPPVAGTFALGSSLGPIARRVEDVSLLFDVLANEHGSKHGGGRDDDNKGDFALSSGGKCVAWYTDDGLVPVTPETRRAVERAARALARNGYFPIETLPPHVARASELWTPLFSPSTASYLRKVYDGREEEAGPVARFLMERAAKLGEQNASQFGEALSECRRLRREMSRWMTEWPLLLAPVGAVPALEHETRKVTPAGETSFGVFRAFSYAQAFNVLDLPAATVRAGWTDDGLPIGIQIVGRPRHEREVLAAARVVEEDSGGWQGVPENLSKVEGNPV